MRAAAQSSAEGIRKARSVRHVDPVLSGMATSLAGVTELRYVKIFPERIAASNVLSSDGKKNPVVEVGAEGIVGVELLVDPTAKVVQFFALTSAVKGCGRRMVEAVVAATPEDWRLVVLFDWSGGFWGRMVEEQPRLVVASMPSVTPFSPVEPCAPRSSASCATTRSSTRSCSSRTSWTTPSSLSPPGPTDWISPTSRRCRMPAGRWCSG